jgi:hypothetical protein
MAWKTYSRTGWMCAALVLLAVAPSAFGQMVQGQNPAPSLAEVARQARAERKTQPRTKFVWTNDNLPTGSGDVSVVGAPSGETAESAHAGAAEGVAAQANGNAGEKSAAKQASLRERLTQAKEQLASLRIDLNLAQRQFTLDQNQFDGNPNRANDSDGQAKLRAESQLVDEKKQQVAGAEEHVAQLEKEMGPESNAPAPDTAPTPQP